MKAVPWLIGYPNNRIVSNLAIGGGLPMQAYGMRACERLVNLEVYSVPHPNIFCRLISSLAASHLLL